MPNDGKPFVIPEVIPLCSHGSAPRRKKGRLRTACHMLRLRWRAWIGNPYSLKEELGKMAFWAASSAVVCWFSFFTWGYSVLFCILATLAVFVAGAIARGAFSFWRWTASDWAIERRFAEDINNLQDLTNAVAEFAYYYGTDSPTKPAMSVMAVCALLHELPNKEDGLGKWCQRMRDMARAGYTYLYHALQLTVDPNLELDLSTHHHSREAVEQLLMELLYEDDTTVSDLAEETSTHDRST